MLRATHCSRTVSYLQDQGTARCRLHPEDMKIRNIFAGSIIECTLYRDDTTTTCEALLVAWPVDSASDLDQGSVIIDTTVCKLPTNVTKISWSVFNCKISAIHPFTYTSSLQVEYKDPNAKTQISFYSYLPVASGFTIHPHPKTTKTENTRCFTAVARHTLPLQPIASIVSPYTILTSSFASEVCFPAVTSRAKCTPSPFVCTTVVEELVRRVVRPCLQLPRHLHLHGVLLVGPPGSGKTHSVHVLRQLCAVRGWCRVRIHELNVPDLLVMEDPLGYLRQFFAQACQPSATKHTIAATSKNNGHGGSPNPASTPSPKPPPIKTSKAPVVYTPLSRNKTATADSPISPTDASKPSSAVKGFSFLHHNLSTIKSPQTPAATAASVTVPSSSTRVTSLSEPAAAIVTELSLILIDEVDALGRRRQPGASGAHSQSVEQAAIVSFLCDWLDQCTLPVPSQRTPASTDTAVNSLEGARPAHTDTLRYCLVATTNRGDDVDGRLRRGGRLGTEIDATVTRADRVKLMFELLSLALKPMWASQQGGNYGSKERSHSISVGNSEITIDMDPKCIEAAVEETVEKLGGYAAADISSLCSECCEQLSQVLQKDSARIGGAAVLDKHVLVGCIERAARAVPSSALRTINVDLPKLSLSEVIGCEAAKRALCRILSFADPARRLQLVRFGLAFPGGALLYGPPGNSKTRLVKAAASTYGLPVISLSAADVYSAYVGDAEAAIRRTFRLARQAAPCVLLLDEVDALVTDRYTVPASLFAHLSSLPSLFDAWPSRGYPTGGGDSVSVESRVLATLLTELDGVSEGADSAKVTGTGGSAQGVFVLATSNRLAAIDAALLRKGRFHHIIHVPSPSPNERVLIAKYFGTKYGLNESQIQKICDSVIMSKAPGFSEEGTCTDTESLAGMSGADVENLCREAAMGIIRKTIQKPLS